MADVQTLKTGIRTIAVSKDYGFQLNGVTRKLKGVCLHHTSVRWEQQRTRLHSFVRSR